MNKPFLRSIGFTTAVFLLVLIIPSVVRNDYYLHVLIRLFISILVAIGLRLIMTTGLVSFAHCAFMAIGAYTSAVVTIRFGVSTWLGLFFAVLTTVVFAAAFGCILLRLKGTYFLMASFAFAELVLLSFSQTEEPFGGAGGLMSIPLPDSISLLGMSTLSFGSKLSFYYLAAIFLLIPLWIVTRLEKTSMGRIWTSIQQADVLTLSVGINIMRYKVYAFVIGSSLAALGGAFIAHYSSHLNPSQFNVFELVNYLAFVMIGGTKKIYGPVIGAILLTFIGEYLSLFQHLAYYQSIIYGIVLILVVLFLPDGLISLPDKISKWRQQQCNSTSRWT